MRKVYGISIKIQFPHNGYDWRFLPKLKSMGSKSRSKTTETNSWLEGTIKAMELPCTHLLWVVSTLFVTRPYTKLKMAANKVNSQQSAADKQTLLAVLQFLKKQNLKVSKKGIVIPSHFQFYLCLWSSYRSLFVWEPLELLSLR